MKKSYNEILQQVTDLCTDIQDSKNLDATVKNHKWQPLINAANNLALIAKAAAFTQKPTQQNPPPAPPVEPTEPEAEEEISRALLADSTGKKTRKKSK